MLLTLETSWKEILSTEIEKLYFKKLKGFMTMAYANTVVFPPKEQIFNAFNLCPFEKISVVILGQDPYHGEGQAHGLAFSVADDFLIPPSLRNIYKEIVSDMVVIPSISGNLERWAKQGVLLLNSTLTVEAGKAGSHQGLGWEQFTDAVITKIATEKTNVVFLLWGAFAISKRTLVDESKHLVLTAPHPSPLSAYRGFFGCKHFSQANTYLRAHKHVTITW